MYNLNGVPDGLIDTNTKVIKGEPHGVLTELMHFAPARVSGFNVCRFSSAGCRASCLNTAGNGGIGLDEDGLNRAQAARIRRTRYFKNHHVHFLEKLVKELGALERRAKRRGMLPAARLNGTSDLPWERIRVEIDGERFRNVMRAFPDITFYDYTKYPLELRGERVGGELPPNYSLTFSLSENNESRARDALARGVNLAVVFRHELPDEFWGYEVINGEEHDLRYLDQRVRVVGLLAKGEALKDKTGFVRD